MNAVELLKEDHREVLNLITELEITDNEMGMDPTDTENFKRLNESVKIHSQIEEELFYPEMEEIEEARMIVEEFYIQHKNIDRLLEQLSKVPYQEEFQELLSEFRNELELHIEEEEEDLFPKAEEKLGQYRLNEMGRQIQERKKKGQTSAASMKRR